MKSPTFSFSEGDWSDEEPNENKPELRAIRLRLQCPVVQRDLEVLRARYAELPDTLSARALVAMGFYRNVQQLRNERHKGYGPPANMVNGRLAYDKEEILRWILFRSYDER